MKVNFGTRFNLTMFLLLWSFLLYAQKIPNKQENSFWLPDSVKIDGLAKEWNNKFQAYNHATETAYTLANNLNYLYLIVHATDITIIRKIVYGGITFTIKNKNNDNQAMFEILLPYLTKKDQGTLLSLYTNAGVHKINNLDSLRKLNGIIMNKAFLNIKGINTLNDSLFSISRAAAIDVQAMANIDDAVTYTCEIKIPLKYIASAIDKNNTISYGVKLNGQYYGSNNKSVLSADGKMMGVYSANGHGTIEFAATPESTSLNMATDFKGDYKLAKAQ